MENKMNCNGTNKNPRMLNHTWKNYPTIKTGTILQRCENCYLSRRIAQKEDMET
jgi:hypothetical protein